MLKNIICSLKYSLHLRIIIYFVSLCCNLYVLSIHWNRPNAQLNKHFVFLFMYVCVCGGEFSVQQAFNFFKFIFSCTATHLFA